MCIYVCVSHNYTYIYDKFTKLLISTKLATYSEPHIRPCVSHLADRRPGRWTLGREIDHKFLLRHPSTSLSTAWRVCQSLVLVSTSNRWLAGWLDGWMVGWLFWCWCVGYPLVN